MKGVVSHAFCNLAVSFDFSFAISFCQLAFLFLFVFVSISMLSTTRCPIEFVARVSTF